jgi:phosphohistidine phosphatase SixA
MSKVILIRHGESLGNTDEAYYQLPDVANILSQKGVDQCVALSQEIHTYLPNDFHGLHTTVIASRYQRAQLTAQIVMSKTSPQIIIDHRINEVYHCARSKPDESRESVVERVRSLVKSHHWNLVLFTHGMLMGVIDPEKGGAKNAEIRVYDRQEFLDRYLK